MDKIKSFLKNHWQKIGYALLSLFLPMLCVLAILVLRGAAVRGDASLFLLGYGEELLSRIAQAKEIGGSLLSFGKYIWQGDIFLLLAGLLPTSPLGSLVAAFMLSAGLTSFAAYLSLRGFDFEKTPSLVASLLYGLNAYAFLAFVVSGTSGLLLVLPFVLWAEHHLIQKGKMLPFALALSFAFLLSARCIWICILAVVAWFFYDTFGFSAQKREKTKKILPRLGIGCAVALAFGLPELIIGFKELTLSPSFSFDANLDILSFFAKMLPTVYDGVEPTSLPYLCFGILPILVLPLYFSSPSIEKREKIASALFLTGIGVTLVAKLVDTGVDLFEGQGDLGYAQACLFGFVALFLCARVLSSDQEKNHSPLFIAYGFFSFFLVIVQKLSLAYHTKENINKVEYPIDGENIWITLFLATILVFALHSFLKRNHKRVACLVAVGLVATVSAEAVFGQMKLLKSLQTEYPYYAREQLQQYYDAYSESLEALMEEADEGYRMEKMNTIFGGENRFLGFSGIDSLGDSSVVGLLGGKAYSTGAVYQSGIPALDALLSVKYFAKYHPLVEDGEETAETTPKKKSTFEKIKEALFKKDTFVNELSLSDTAVPYIYSLLLEEELYSLWENPYALSLLSSYGGGLKDLDFSFPSEKDLVENEAGEYVYPEGFSMADAYYSPAQRLNSVWSALAGQEVTLFKKLSDLQNRSVFVSTQKCTATEDELGHTVYVANEGEKTPYVKFTVSVSSDVEVLLYLPALFGREAELVVNGMNLGLIHKDNQVENGFISIGQFEEDSIIQVEIHFATEKGYNDFYILKDQDAGEDWTTSLFWVADNEAFLSMMAQASFGEFTTEKITNNRLVGTLTPDAGETAVFTSLAYRQGTTVKVDGKKVNTYAIAGGLLGFDLPDDQSHEIEIRQGKNPIPSLSLILGILGGVSLLALALYEIVEKEKWIALWNKCFGQKKSN